MDLKNYVKSTFSSISEAIVDTPVEYMSTKGNYATR